MNSDTMVAILFSAICLIGYSSSDPQPKEIEERTIISRLRCLKCRRIFSPDDYCCQRGEKGCCGGFNHHGASFGPGRVISVVVKPGIKETIPSYHYGPIVQKPIAVVPQPVVYVPKPVPVMPQPIAYVPKPIPIMPQPIRFPSQCTCYPHLGVKTGKPVHEQTYPTYPGSPVVTGSPVETGSPIETGSPVETGSPIETGSPVETGSGSAYVSGSRGGYPVVTPTTQPPMGSPGY